MEWIISFIEQHPVISTFTAYYVFSSAVGAMPSPSTGGSKFYEWFFNFSQALGANVARMAAQKYPQHFK